MNLHNSLSKTNESLGELNTPFYLKDSAGGGRCFPVRHIARFAIAFPTGVPWRLGFVMSLIALFAAVQSLAAELAVPGDYPTITEALAVADNGDKILVDAQTYPGEGNESFPLRLQKSISLMSDSDTGEKPHLKGDGKHTVVVIESGGVTLKGFQITGGKGSEGINNMDGGGVCIFVGPSETNAVTIQNCIIRDNNCPSDETYDGCGGGIYCGGTYCTCFEINIVDCNIWRNSVHGQGGGVFCALLSNVNIQDTVIWQNIADDHGGGVFVDVFALVLLADTRLSLNNCPGDRDSIKPNWGGKGGGLACESYGLFTATDCIFAENTARNFGGGIFTRGGLFAGEKPCGNAAQFPYISNSLIEKNRAEVSGGGVYVAGSGVLDFFDTTLYWNDAGQDGGAVFVAGGLIVGGDVYFGDDCLLEGNECAGRGGGVYLGPYAHGTFESMRFLGNSALFDGGAMFLETGSASELTNCLITYNNSARGYAGGIRVTEQQYIDTNNLNLDHCSVVGNFAPHKRSGLYLDPNAIVYISNSILWRNAGGSIEDNGATVNITCSLNEDGAYPNNGVLCCDPKYVGWGSLEGIYVDASSPCPGIGTSESPYCDLQTALYGFDFHLAANSPCVGAANDSGNLGADTGDGGTAGNITATLFIANGTYDIRGRNIIFTSDVQGSDPNLSIIRHAVFGYVEDAFIKDLCITGEEIFGGIAVRSDVKLENCHVNDNTALAEGGGIYVAKGHCDVNNTLVSNNTCEIDKGGGIFVFLGASLGLARSRIEQNAAAYGGAIYVAGQVTTTDVNVVSNKATDKGGGTYIATAGDLISFGGTFSSNSASSWGGAICSYGKMEVYDANFVSNSADFGGAIYIRQEPAGPSICSDSQFRKNKANHQGGALYLNMDTAPYFSDCNFVENRAFYRGGAGLCWHRCLAMFDSCDFIDNSAFGGSGRGGSFYMALSKTRFHECFFSGSSATLEGGVAIFYSSDISLFEKCRIEGSSAGSDGGAFCITNSAQPVFLNVEIVNSQAVNNGGGIAILETSKPLFSQVTISNCQAVLFGGGVYATNNTQSTFEKCEFLNNQTTGVSADGGGAFFRGNANGSFTRCVFHDNVAKDDGGGVAGDENVNLDLRNTLFASNTAGNTGGGAFFTSTSSGTLTNCTIVSNKANGESGGGIYMDSDSTVKVDSSIIWQNTPDCIRPGADPNVSYSCIQGGWPTGMGNLGSDPLLDPNTFEPQDGSSCIDAGNPDPNMNDSCLPPGKSDLRNDMGITGGPDNCVIDFQRQFDFTTFSDPAFLVLRGNASFTDGLLRLTEAQKNKVGGAWYALPVYVQGGFETEFDFRIDQDGADGFAFVIQNSSLSDLGNNGPWLGYNIPNSIAVEFDTWRNRAYGDTNANHVCVQTRGTLTNSPDHQYSLGCNDDIPPLSDNQPHTAKIVYVAGQHLQLSIFFGDIEEANLIVPLDLENILSLTDGRAFVGFTAATGGAVETHDILSWSFASAEAPAGDD